MLDEPVRILAHFEEISFLLGGLHFPAAIGALAVYKLAFRPEAFARGTVQALVRALVNIALIIELSENLFNRFLVIAVRGTYELVVRHVHNVPYPLYLGGYPVHELLGGYALCGGFLFNLQAVLVRARHKENVVALHTLKTADCVRKNRLVSIADMRLARSIGYRGSKIKFFFHKNLPTKLHFGLRR